MFRFSRKITALSRSGWFHSSSAAADFESCSRWQGQGRREEADCLRAAGMTWINTVIECVGRPSTIEQAIELAGNKAVVMMFGLTKPDETISVKPFQIFQKELELKASYINPYTQKRALDLIDSGRLDVSSMVYEVCGLDRLADVLSRPELRANGKYIISPEK